MLSCTKVHRFPPCSWMMGENRRSGLSRHGFSQASLHRARLCRPVPSHTENTNIATIPWSSKECCLNFLTSVVPSWAPRFPSSEGPYCMARLSFITSMALKESVGEGGVGWWKSEPKLINWSFSRKCRQQNIRKLKRTNSSAVTKQGWGRQKQGKSSENTLRAIRTHPQCWQVWLVWSVKEMATCNCTVVIQSFQFTIKHANLSY